MFGRRLASLMMLAVGFGPVMAADWPTWRGPRVDGTADTATYATTWSPENGILWKAPLPGSGHSSPIVIRGKVFVTSCVEADKKRVLTCYDRQNGKVLWEREIVTAPLERKHKLNSFASATPASDGERVYVTFYDQPHLRVYCYDMDGKKLWEKSPGQFHSVHGFCSPPILYKDFIIINGDQDAPSGLKAYIVALDRKTGEERWRIDRPNKLRSYCPPVIIEAAGKTQMVLTGSKCVTSYSPDTGEQYWIVNGPTEQFVSSIVFHQGLVFLTAGFPEHWVMAIDPSGSGNVTNSHIRWSKKTKDAGYVPSPVAHDGRFFLVSDDGIGSAWDALSGKQLWRERLGGHHSGSGVVANGRVYFTDDDGVTFVLKAGAEFELLSKNPIGEHCYSSPAFSDGNIFLRGEKHLFCVAAPR